MESLFDKTVLLVASLALFLLTPPDATGVALWLGAFTIAASAQLLPERASIALLLAGVVFACIYPLAAVFLAPVVHGCAFSRFRWTRWAWPLAPFLAFWHLPPLLWAISTMLDLLACALALRCAALLRERRQYRILRDTVREQALALEQRNRQLRDQVSSLKAQETASSPTENAPAMPASAESSRDTYPTLNLDGLTERELEIASHVAHGLDNKEIAAQVFASEGTVRNHVSAILQKSGLHNRTQLAVAYLNSLGL